MAAHAVAAPHPSLKTALVVRLMSLWGGLRAPAEKEPLLLTNRIRGEADIPPLDRLSIAQWLWGAGYHIPGGEAHLLDLVKPFALNPAMSVLDVAAGLGGAARAISQAFGTYVTGLERDAELARHGMEMSLQQGMQKRAPIESYDPNQLKLRSGL